MKSIWIENTGSTECITFNISYNSVNKFYIPRMAQVMNLQESTVLFVYYYRLVARHYRVKVPILVCKNVCNFRFRFILWGTTIGKKISMGFYCWHKMLNIKIWLRWYFVLGCYFGRDSRVLTLTLCSQEGRVRSPHKNITHILSTSCGNTQSPFLGYTLRKFNSINRIALKVLSEDG